MDKTLKTILVAFMVGGIANGIITWREFAVAQNKILNIEKSQEELKDDYKKSLDKIDSKLNNFSNDITDLKVKTTQIHERIIK